MRFPPWFTAAALGCAVLCTVPPVFAQTLPDEPPDRGARPRPAVVPASYAEALASWTKPDDIARFLDATFTYDRARALALAEGASQRPAILTPGQLFATPSGVCVDVARFGVETLNRLDPRFGARYLMLEFEPVVVAGRTLRRHWVATFERDGATYVFADSWRPGHVAGPYRSVDDFVADYARVRERSVVRWQQRDGFERRVRAARRAAS